MEAALFSIQMDFNRAQMQAAQIEQIANGIENLAKRNMEDCMSGVKANWKGGNAVLYIRKGRRLEQELEKSAAELKKTAQTIRKAAQNTYNAEKKAIMTARTRTYRE